MIDANSGVGRRGGRVSRRTARLAVWLPVMLCLLACAANGGRAPTVTPAAPANQVTPAVLGSGPLHITITTPANNAVIGVPQVAVGGLAPPETVLTINDSLVVVGATGQFSTTVPLQEGPNVLEVLASDPEGNQVSTQLIVTYDPAE